MKYDVVVVGGRIGGSVSSMIASQNDLDVLMIEKKQEIGIPVQCAEGTMLSTFQTLDMKPSKKFVCNEVNGATAHAPNGRPINLETLPLGNFMDNSEFKGYILDRKVFDKHLAIESAKAGTDIMMKTTVKDLIIEKGQICGVVAKHLGKTMEIKADIVIAADGVESKMSRLAGLQNHWKPQDVGSCAQFEMVGLDIDPQRLYFYFGREIAPGGYLWIFPKGEDTVNIGVGVRNSQKTAYHYLKKFTQRFDATPVELNIGGVPISGPAPQTYTDGFMVVGDAAGQVDPMTGGGIHLTAFCAKVAGQVASDAVEGEDFSSSMLSKYDYLWREKYGEKLEISLKYRKAANKLTDKDMNALAEFIEKNNLENLSKIAALKFLGKNPQLLKLIKDFI
jgi:digeranylgeranylglycerophospholipid reductase